MSAPVDADAVWSVLGPLGWDRWDEGDYHSFSNSELCLYEPIQLWESGRLTITVKPHQWGWSMCQALAALSRLLGDTGHAAPDEVTHG